MAFMHGAQDGQKFMGVFMLGVFLAKGQYNVTSFTIPVWLMVLCSAVMALGTSLGGYKIIKMVGMDMVKLNTFQGFAADAAATASLFAASVMGFPVSTTHTKTTAIMGVGASKRLSNVTGVLLMKWLPHGFLHSRAAA
jgi:PiT family inorganic phosphate transporter